MSNEQIKPNYWAHLTAEVRYDKNISSIAKLIYAELTALTSVEGYAWASNGYFAELYDLSECQISRIIKSLSDAGYIRIELTRNPDDKRVTLRKIWIIKGNESEIHCKNDKADLCKNDKVHLCKNRKDNITNNNTINITVVPSEPFPEDPTKVKEEKKSFKKTDYSECISLINSCKNTLSSKGKFVDKTEFRISAVNKWLKQWFTEYGVEATKKGIVNAMSFKFVTDNGFKLSILFSDKIFPQCVSNSFTNYSSYSNKQSLVGSEFDKSHENTVFNHDDEGAWK